MADSDAGPLVIRELEGERRTLALRGRALPYRPVSFDVEQRHEKTTLQGNPVATIQVFGPEAKDLTCHGFWKEIFIGDESVDSATLNGARVSTVVELSNLVQDVCRRGSEVEVSWMHEGRRGVLQSFKKNWHNLLDLEWEMTFVWEGFSEDFAPGPAVDPGTALRSVAEMTTQVASRAQTLVDKAAAVVSQAGAAAQAARDGILHVQRAVSDLGDMVAQAAQGITAPAATALQAAAGFQTAATSAGDVFSALHRRVERAAFGFVPQDVPTSVQAAQANRDAARAARDTRVQAARARRAALAQANPDLLAAFVAREDTDLRQVALEFYRSADGWRRIADFNDLQSSRLTAGQVVFVPRSRGGP